MRGVKLMDFKELIDFEYQKRIIKLSLIGNFSVLIKGNSQSGKTSILNCIRKIFNISKSLRINNKRFYCENKILFIDDLHNFELKEIEFIFNKYVFNQFFICSHNCWCGNVDYAKKCLYEECESKSIELYKIWKFIKSKIDLLITLEKPHDLLYNKTYPYYSEDSKHILSEVSFAKKLLSQKNENFVWEKETGRIYELFKITENPTIFELQKITRLAETVSALEGEKTVKCERMSEAIQYYLNKEDL